MNKTLYVCVPINLPGSLHHYNTHKPTILLWNNERHVDSVYNCAFRAEILDFSKLSKALSQIRIHSHITFLKDDPYYEVTRYHVFDYKRHN